MVRQDEPIYLSKDAHDNDLIGKPRWSQLHRYVKNTNKMKRILKADKAKQKSNTVKIKFGVNIPSEHKGAIIFDGDNENINWKDYDLLELKQIYNFNSFKSIILSTRHVSLLFTLKSNYILYMTSKILEV